jgi:hypothetical protein
VFLAVMGWIATWFLIGPLLGPTALQGYYRPVLHVFTYGYNRPLLLAFVPFALAILAWRRGSRVSIRWLVVGALVLHVLLLFAPTPQSQDVHQYLFYGRMQVLHTGSDSIFAAHAGNPYVVPPNISYEDEWYRWVKWPTQTTVYGPAWSLVSYGVAAASGGSHTVAYLLMKLVILALDLSIIWSILAASRDRPDPHAFAGLGLLVYAWNPLVLVSVPLGGLVDVALAAGLVGAYVADRRGRPWVTTLLLALITLVKVYAGIALILWLVLLIRRRGPRAAAMHAGFALAVGVVLFAPYWAGFQTFAGLFHVANLSNHSLVGVLQRVLTPAISALGVQSPWHLAGALVRWGGLALLVAAVVHAVLHARTRQSLWHGVLLVLTVYCLFTPWFFYWYLVAPIALVAIMPDDELAAPVVTASGTMLFSIAFWPWLLGQVVEILVRYAPPVAVWLSRSRLMPADRTLHAAPPAAGTPVEPDEPEPAEIDGEAEPAAVGSSGVLGPATAAN